MKSVSTAFKTVWARKHGRKEILKVVYYRQYWNGSAKVYEATGTTLEQGEVPPMRSINWQLDTAALNEFKSSNVTLSLNDLDRRWLPFSAAPSVFAPDYTAALGYLPYGTKFQVYFGYILDDGTKEYAALFTGLAESFRYGTDGTVEITVASNDRLLRDADAQEISDAFTLENCVPAMGNGTITAFVTTSVGVGSVSVVQVNGVTMVQGTDYTIQNLGERTGAQINFTVAPGNTLTVKSTGRKWKADRTIEYLVGLVCDEAGIGSGVRSISSALFPGGVSSAKTIDSQADWAAGSGTNVDSSATPGSIRRQWHKIDTFADNDYTASPAWTVRKNENGLGTVSAAAGALAVTLTDTPSDHHIDTPVDSRDAYGSWEFSLQVSSGATGNLANAAYAHFIQYGAGAGSVGYYVAHRLGSADYHFGRVDSGTLTPLLALTGTCDASAHTWRVTRSTAGEFNIYRDGSLVGTHTDTNYTLTNYFGLRSTFSQIGVVTHTLDNIYFSNSVLTPATAVSDSNLEWISAEQDLAAAPISWGQLERTETLNGGTITYSTSVSNSSGAGYDAYVAIGGDGTIQSALKRYLKIKVVFTAATGYQSCLVDKLIARYATDTVLVAIADFTGKTCYEAISVLAKLCNYEWGFEGDGDFFFRSKTVTGAAVITLNQENAIADLSDYKIDYAAVINLVRVRYGDEEQYEAVYGSVEAAEAEPTSQTKYGVRLREENSSEFLLANETVIALGRARLVYEDKYLPRVMCQLTCRAIPHLDLSDIISATYMDRPRDYDPPMNDPQGSWGDASFGPAANVLLRDKRMKAVGVSFMFPQSKEDGFRTKINAMEIFT